MELGFISIDADGGYNVLFAENFDDTLDEIAIKTICSETDCQHDFSMSLEQWELFKKTIDDKFRRSNKCK